MYDQRKKLPRPPDAPACFQYWRDSSQPIVWGLDLQERGFNPFKSYVVLPRPLALKKV